MCIGHFSNIYVLHLTKCGYPSGCGLNAHVKSIFTIFTNGINNMLKHLLTYFCIIKTIFTQHIVYLYVHQSIPSIRTKKNSIHTININIYFIRSAVAPIKTNYRTKYYTRQCQIKCNCFRCRTRNHKMTSRTNIY